MILSLLSSSIIRRNSSPSLISLPTGHSIVVGHGYYNNFRHQFKSIYDIYLKITKKEQIKSWYDPYLNIEIFNMNKNSFEKIKINNKFKNNHEFSNLFLYENKIYIMETYYILGYIFDIQNKLNQRKYVDLNDSILFPIMVLNNDLICFSNNSHLHTIDIKDNIYFTLTPNVKEEEGLVWLDLNTFQIKKKINFEQKVNFIPLISDIKVLQENKKILIPFRQINTNARFEIEGFNNSYIQIYDIENDKFYTDYNVDILNNNLFQIKLKDGNILFINKDSSYIFDNKNNIFLEASKNEIEKNKLLTSKIESLLKEQMDIDLFDTTFYKTKIIKLNNSQYLLTCGDYYLNQQERKKRHCNRSIYFNYWNSEVSRGPNFILDHTRANYINLSNNKTLIIGGTKKEDKDFFDIPNNKIQFIKIMEEEK